MKEYYTEVEIEKYNWEIGYKDKILFLGSCFTENIGEIMQGLKFNTMINPFGIIYNPLSVIQALQQLLDNKIYTEKDLFEQKGVFGSFDFHSRYSASSANEALLKMNHQVEEGREFLRQADVLIITLGTSWVYKRNETDSIAANCHKFPASHFTRFRLSVDEIVAGFVELLTELWKFNQKFKVVFTVSPIRHIKDGSVGNQLSKSTLLLAVDQLVNYFGKSKCDYFPSYEIVMDELRDYRFYASDLVHLSPVAVEHIWKRFKGSIVQKKDEQVMKKIDQIRKAMEHKVFRKDVPEYRDFLTKNIQKIEELMLNFPYLNLDREKSYFQGELSDYENL